MKSNFNRLDEVKGTLRILIILGYSFQPVPRLELIKECKEDYLGRTAFYSAHKALMELGLIEEKSETRDGKRVVLTNLKEKGKKVVTYLVGIQKLMD
jgi:hypothetical protein